MLRVAFLRAVNLGRRRVEMAKLAEVVEELGHHDVWTYVNSGNVVFEGAGERDRIEHELESAFERAFGFEVTTFVRTDTELRRALAVDPFRLRAGDTYFLTFLKAPPPKAKAAAFEALGNDFDTLVVKGRDVHWRMRGKSTDTTIPTRAWEQLAGRHCSTSRNTTMLRKLVDKIDARR